MKHLILLSKKIFLNNIIMNNYENFNSKFSVIDTTNFIKDNSFKESKSYFEEKSKHIQTFFKSIFGKYISDPFIKWVNNKYPNKQDRIVFWIMFTILSIIIILYLIFKTINFTINGIFMLLYQLTFGVFFWILRFLYKFIMFIFGGKKIIQKN